MTASATASDSSGLLDPALPGCLARASAYPHDPSAAEGVQEIQTHLSHVFLTGERVYKVKKSVDLGFVNFRSQEARNLDCVRELALNRRLAPDVYLGIAPIERRDGGFLVGALDPDPGDASRLGRGEHCVVMRRLPAGRDASSLLEAGRLPAAWIDTTADLIAAFHERQRLGTPGPFPPETWLDRIWRPVAANFGSMQQGGGEPVESAEIRRLQARATEAFERLHPAFEARRLAGRVVDGHGDLHLEHFWFEGDDGHPVVIDCLEFDEALRCIDAASEVAFLAMDLGFRGHGGLAERWLASYAAAADDYGLYDVVDFFISYRAAVRAKVEAIAARDAEIPETQRRESAARARQRVRFAIQALQPRGRGRVYLVGGLIGAGKSTLARALAEGSGAVVVSTDAVRRRDAVAQAQPAAPGDWQSGRYAPRSTARIYEAVLARAEPVVASGRPVVLDASWSRGEQRERARRWAAGLGAPSCFFEARCSREQTLQRLARRRARGDDPSEAGPEIYDRFANDYEAVAADEWPASRHRVVHTDRESWRDELKAHASSEEDPDV